MSSASIESSTMFKMEWREHYGTVPVATKPILALGTIIMREKPLLFWNTHQCHEFFDQFLQLSDEKQKLICAMFVKPTYNVMERAVSLLQAHARFQKLGTNFAAMLIAIADINAHSYCEKRLGTFQEVMEGLSSSTNINAKSALLEFGSNLATSCCPNTFCSELTSDGFIEYRVIRPIQNGDVICASLYLDHVLEMPTFFRRMSMLSMMGILCHCQRCYDQDYCRLYQCPHATTTNCVNYIPCTNDMPLFPTPEECIDSIENTENHKWICPHCGILESCAIHNKEKENSKKMDKNACSN
jgi:hypothetical protein